jgi:hypothetical protein
MAGWDRPWWQDRTDLREKRKGGRRTDLGQTSEKKNKKILPRLKQNAQLYPL